MTTPGNPPPLGPVLVLRHGETEWSRTHRHTGRTDVPLTSRGEAQARAWGTVIRETRPRAILVSPLGRARRTAELAGLLDSSLPVREEPELQEWDYGDVEGITTKQWREDHPGWSVWDHGAPNGETLAEVAARADTVLAEVRRLLDAQPGADGDAGPVVLVAHGHLLRVLAARWLGLEPVAGRMLVLAAGAVGELGFEHEWPALTGWNLHPRGFEG